ncbi:dimethylaniline monooxygenase [N-oxide-forming] 2-like [Ptychodera flava]|uniref:dimethylaniline monooxygenase [N-oxide-forming] 2-like n=1 Tax=Ptychodera flava TaxID=63121 RepID=UPI003969C9A1
MKPMNKRVAVIGAGASGLATIKSCVEEGLEPVCFERHDQLGGLWYFTEKLRPGQVAATYRSIITNTSKEIFVYSDFPLPKETPVFPPRQRIHQYLKDYADHFGLEKYIRYNCNVVQVVPATDHASSGKWNVHFQDGRGQDGGKIETFDGVIVCSGGFGDIYVPQISGIEDYEGLTMHSNQYREPSPFEGKRVVVVGAAFTAGELACELGRHYCKVYLSMRNGTNVMPRLAKNGLPFFLSGVNRANLTFLSHTGKRIFEEHKKCRTPDNELYGLAAKKNRGQPESIMSNDEIQDCIAAGQVEIIDEIVNFTKTGVVLADGRTVSDVDVVIFATGYLIQYKMLDQKLIFDDSGYLNLYKYILPVELEHPTLTIVGVLSTFIPSTWNTFELQGRWSARLLSGKMTLPCKRRMQEDIRRRPRPTRHYKVLDCTLYQDELARDLGILPSVLKLLFTDPRLAYAFYFLPPVGAWYRLQGQASWTGARNAIFSVWGNIFYAMNPRSTKRTWKMKFIEHKRCILCFSALVLATIYFRRTYTA